MLSTTTTPNRKERVAAILLSVISVLTFAQLKIPDFPGITERGITVASTLVMIVISILGLVRQYLSDQIHDTAMRFGWTLLVISCLEVIIDYTGAFGWSEAVQQAIRFWISIAIGILNLISKMAFPTVAGETASRFRI